MNTEESYYQGLLYSKTFYKPPEEKEENIRENERNFVDSYSSP